jgi:hypothetical protein
MLKNMTRSSAIIFLLIILISVSKLSQAQNAFITTVNGKNRGYLLTQSKDTSPNQPLIILLHQKGASALTSYRTTAFWKKLSKPTTLVFPMTKDSIWSCDDSKDTENDLLLLKQLIQEGYENFQIDRNRVYIIGEGESYCLAKLFKERYPQLVNATVHFKPTADTNLLTTGNDLINQPVDNNTSFELWKRPEQPGRDYKKEHEDSMKLAQWHKRTAVEIRMGRFAMLNHVKTGIDDKTYMDISNAQQLIDLSLSKWMNDSIAWFVNIAWLRVPQKQEVKFTYQGTNVLIKGEGGGGAIVPITVGFKYALHHYQLRPYVLLGTGLTIVAVLGGKFKTTSINIDPSSIRNNIEAEIRVVSHIVFGSGCEWKLGKRIILGSHIQYMHSAQFKSAGQVNAIKGFSTSIGLGYVFGIKKLY